MLTCSDLTKLDLFLSKLKSVFPVRDLGPLHFFLGIEAAHLPNGLLLTQSKYITNLLAHTKMSDCKPCATPMAVNPSLSKSYGELLSNGEEYRWIVGSLQYITMTQPNIAFSMNKFVTPLTRLLYSRARSATFGVRAPYLVLSYLLQTFDVI